jgi:hypothetical protein
MSLHAQLQRRQADGKPIRIGLIGAGKFGSMYLAQIPRTPGVHLVGIADLSPDGARRNLARVGWSDAQTRAASLDAAVKTGATHIGEDWKALVSHPAIDIVVECTGHPIAAVEHCLFAYANGKHVVNVTVEADAFCGPLLAKKAAEAGVVYSLAFGDQPALICDLVDWARTCGFPVTPPGAATSGCRTSANRRPRPVWGNYGLTPEQAERGGLNPKMFNSFLDGSKPSIESTAVANATGLTVPSNGLLYPAGERRGHPVRDAADLGRRRAREEGHGRGHLVARSERPQDPVRHPHGRVGHGRGRDRVHPQLLRGIQRPHRPERALLHALQALAPDRPRGRHVGGERRLARRGDRRRHLLERRRRRHRQARPAARRAARRRRRLHGLGQAAARRDVDAHRRPAARPGPRRQGRASGEEGQSLSWSDVAMDTSTAAYKTRREMEALFAAPRLKTA